MTDSTQDLVAEGSEEECTQMEDNQERAAEPERRGCKALENDPHGRNTPDRHTILSDQEVDKLRDLCEANK